MSKTITSIGNLSLLVKAACVAIFCVFGHHAFSQGELYIFGVVKDYTTSAKLEGVTVRVLDNGSVVDQQTTKSNGKYEFFLDLNKNYTVDFKRDGMVGKNVSLDARNIPEDAAGAGFSMNIEMTLFEEVEGLDASVLQKPIGKAKFDPAKNTIEWDFSYTQGIQSEINKMMKDVEEKKKEAERLAAEEEKARAQALKDFESAMAAGDKAFNAKNYQEAVAQYEKAVSLKADDAAAHAKLESSREKLKEQEAEQEVEAAYAKALEAGDSAMRTEEFKSAIAAYESALEIKPDESYPKEQIEEATRRVEEKEAARQNEEAYAAAMQEARDLVAQKEYESALSKLNEAISLKPGDSDANALKREVQEMLDQLAENAKKQDEYDALIVKANGEFDSEQFEEAIATYNQALELIDDPFPKEQIAKAAAELEAREAEAQAEQRYADAMQRGKEEFDAKNFEEALQEFQSALEVKPGDTAAQSEIDRVNEALQVANAEAEAEAQFRQLIAEGDGYFEGEDFESAKKSYQEALSLQPEAEHPANQIALIDEKLAQLAQEQAQLEAQQAEEAAREQAFTEAITLAREQLSAANYPDALTSVANALTIKPESEEASKLKEQIELEQSRAADAEELQRQYEEAVSKADALFESEEFEEALAAYEKAQAIKPTENYPSGQIAVINAKLDELASAAERAEREKVEAEYQAAMTAGNTNLQEQDFDAATASFQLALTVKPGDREASAKLEEVAQAKANAADEAAREEAFRNAMIAGETHFGAGEWQKAISAFQVALQNKANDSEATSKLQEATERLEEEESALALDEQYTRKLEAADALYEQPNLEAALTAYNEASALKPGESYPKDQIVKIEEALAQIAAEEAEAQRLQAIEDSLQRAENERLELEKRFNNLLSEGEKNLANENLEVALEQFQEAATLKPEAKEPPAKIAEVNEAIRLRDERLAEEKRLAEEARKLREEQEKAKREEERYKTLLADGDEAFLNRDFKAAKQKYSDALSIKPGEIYPKTRLDKVEQLLILEADNKSNDQVNDKPKKSNSSRNFARIRGNSEDEAEQFMRDARLAEEKERHERIKKLKSSIEEANEERNKEAAQTRAEIYDDLKRYENGETPQFNAQQGLAEKRSQNIMRYKEVLESNSGKQAKKQEKQIQSSYAGVQKLDEQRGENQNKLAKEAARDAQDVVRANQNLNDQRNARAQEAYESVIEQQNQLAEWQAELAAKEQNLAEQRTMEARKVAGQREQIEEANSAANNEQLTKVRDNYTVISNQKSQLEAANLERRTEAAENVQAIEEQRQFMQASDQMAASFAEKRREDARKNAQAQDMSFRPKDFDNYNSSNLSEKYPQGVTEESSTEGNKVIIKRIVVIGNKADEYRKVVDKSGNYYFKNGVSISETTWNQETVVAFD